MRTHAAIVPIQKVQSEGNKSPIVGRSQQRISSLFVFLEERRGAAFLYGFRDLVQAEDPESIHDGKKNAILMSAAGVPLHARGHSGA